jgi:hypothetical protein
MLWPRFRSSRARGIVAGRAKGRHAARMRRVSRARMVRERTCGARQKVEAVQ